MTKSSHDKSVNKPEPKQEGKSKSAHSLIIALLATLLIILIIAISALAYFFQQSRQAATLSATSIEQLDQQVSSNESNIIQQQLVTNQQQHELTQLLKNNGHKKRDWVMAEAEYITRIANYVLQFENNIPASTKLLIAADQRIASLSDPDLTDIRESLANNISELNALSNTDTEGLLLKLNALSAQIESLPSMLTNIKDEKAQTPKANMQEQNESMPAWQQGLWQSWEKLKEIIVIEHHDTPIKSKVNQYDRVYIDQHLNFLFAQTQWAIIHQKEQLYAASLTQAEAWVKEYYASNSAKTQAMLSAISELMQVDVKPDYPNLAKSIQKMHALLIEDGKQAADPEHREKKPERFELPFQPQSEDSEGDPS